MINKVMVEVTEAYEASEFCQILWRRLIYNPVDLGRVHLDCSFVDDET